MKFIKIALMAILLTPSLACGKAPAHGHSRIVLSETNSVLLADEVNPTSVTKVLKKIQELDESLPSKEPIYLILDTPGGSIQSGLELIDSVKGLNRPIHTITIFAASMGFQIAQNLSDRLILPSGVLMSHKAKGGFVGEFNGDGLSQIDKRYKLWSDRVLEMDRQTVKRTRGKQTLESYRTSYENEMWLTGEQAVAQGYADNIVTAKCDKTLSGTREETVSFFGLQVLVVFSKCPLQTGPIDVKINVATHKKGSIPYTKLVASGVPFGPFCTESSVPAEMSCPIDVTLTLEKIETVRKMVFQKYSPEGRRSNIKNSF